MRRIRLASCVAVVGLLAGCYTLQPASGMSLQVGTKVAFDVNDAGRVALGGTIGPEIGTIEGLLVGKENGEYLLAVSGVRYLRGGQQSWTGERVSVKTDHLGTMYERRFSKGRTAALTVAVVGSVAAIVVSQNLFGLGSLDGPITPIDSNLSLRFRRP